MKKLFLLSTFFLFFSFFTVNSAEARSGCCSHHGGVCGCGCCDGTSLSATCAPYYPSCNNAPVEVKSNVVETNTVVKENNADNQVYKAAAVISSVGVNNPNVNQPTNIETNEINDNVKTEEALPLIEQPQKIINLQDNQAEGKKATNTEQQMSVSANNVKTESNDNSGFWGGLVFWGVIVYIIYLVKKRKNKKNNKKDGND